MDRHIFQNLKATSIGHYLNKQDLKELSQILPIFNVLIGCFKGKI